MQKWLLIFFGFSLFFIITPAPMQASYSDMDLTRSTAMAKLWLSLIDEENYEKSYTLGSPAFRNYVSHDKWVIILKSLRAPLGKLVTRNLVSHEYLANGLDGDEGEHILLHYVTTFSEAPTDELETVSLKRGDDQDWVPAGYHFQAKVDSDSTH